MKKLPQLFRSTKSKKGQAETRSKLTRAELLRTRALLQAIADNSLAVIYVKDLAGIYLLVNRQFEVIFGLRRDQIVGHDDFDIYPRAVAEVLRANDAAVLTSGETQSLEETIPQLDGPHTYISVKFSLHDASGQAYAMAGISTDISERKKVEDEVLKQSVRAGILGELSQLLTSVTLNYQTVLDTIVQRCAELIGDGASIFMVEPEDPFLHLVAVYNPDPEAIEIFRAEMNRSPIRVNEGAYNHVIKNAVPLLFPVVDIEKLKADPATTPERRLYYERLPLYSAMFAPLRAEGKTLGVLGLGRHHADHPQYTQADLVFLQDIADRAALAILNARLYAALEKELSERIEAERQVQRLNAELEQRVMERTAQLESAIKELESFSYTISHDLRAPLRAVNGYANILEQEYLTALPAEAHAHLEKIQAASKKMGTLIDELLAFSRLGRNPLSRATVDLNVIVRAVIESLAPETAHRQIEWTLANLPPAQADPTLIQQVYANLIGNAIKYTRACQPARIEIGYLDQNAERVYSVRDNGTGFDMQYADKLFGVFQRLHREEEFEGTGIGLATVQRIITRHGGRIWAEAAPDKGATFFFTLA